MTTPTQAQIEAAAKALYEYANNHGAKDCSWTVYIAEAKAALTAAAQADEQKIWPKEFWDEAVRLRKQGEQNATIERCAQVAEKLVFNEYGKNRQEIAAAIRKLKDEMSLI
jgi:hypothetical protein